MSEPRWPDDLLVRSFAPRRNPLPAPDTDIFDEPRACAKLNFKWFSHVLGALETLTQPDAWAGDDTDVFDAQQQIEQLIEQLSAECDLSLIDVFGATAPSFATWSAQFLADYGVIPDVPNSWVALGQTLVYGSADGPTFTATCAGVNLTTVLSVGMRIRLSQATGGTKYFIVTGIAFSTNTTLTLYGGTDYTLVNQTISSPYYSEAKAPYGMNISPAKWTVEVVDSTNRTQSSPTSGTWYNPGAVQISVPIGCWRLSWTANMDFDRSTAGDISQHTTLSTANNSESESKLTWVYDGNALIRRRDNASRELLVTLASKATYFLNCKTASSGMGDIAHRGDTMPSILRAVCAYL